MANHNDTPAQKWAELRFAVIGQLLAAPPAAGQLQQRLEEIAAKTWLHPISGQPKRFGFSTIERWYYDAHTQPDPVSTLRRKVRRDRGTARALSPALQQVLREQYQRHPDWLLQLHSDNLRARIAKQPELGAIASYASVVRFMRRNGLNRRRPLPDTEGGQRARRRLEQFEVRSFEVEFVCGLWHLDFHFGHLKVLNARGQWITPILLAVLDDRSRLCCHAQWFSEQTTHTVVHGLMQALLKRGLPRALMSDNGSAMIAAEFEQGLLRLGIVHETTLPYSPYQNGKQENFFCRVENRLVALAKNEPEITLKFLNDTTQAWLELDYHAKVHGETGQTPSERFLAGPSVARDSPSSEDLRLAFTQQVVRTQRRGDGTIVIDTVRFEVPARYRHLKRVHVRYATWDLSRVLLVDPVTANLFATLRPLDRNKNASGQRRRLDPIDNPLPPSLPATASQRPALLEQLLADYAATGLPPPYIPTADDGAQPNPEPNPEAKPSQTKPKE